jgi:hypothetical protein
MLGWQTEYVCFVTRFGVKEHSTSGGTCEADKVVYIRNSDRGRRRLFLLLHEAGHVISYSRGWGKWRRIGWGRARNLRASETRAHLYGWALARRLGIIIDKQQWRAFNWEAFTPHQYKALDLEKWY